MVVPISNERSIYEGYGASGGPAVTAITPRCDPPGDLHRWPRRPPVELWWNASRWNADRLDWLSVEERRQAFHCGLTIWRGMNV